MNITLAQLEYALALEKTGSLTLAAESCHITQPAISMQLKKLEDAVGMILFDRSKQPVQPTAAGHILLTHARQIFGSLTQLEDALLPFRDTMEGTLRLGIIPTLAPYLLPYFIGDFTRAYPKLEVSVIEMKTQDIIQALHKNDLDAGILVTPLKELYIKEQPLFYESFLSYMNIPDKKLMQQGFIEADQILDYKLWILEEGNCFRTQTMNLCGIAQTNYREGRFEYESGNIETLLRMVEKEGGITLIPQLCSLNFSSKQQKFTKRIGKRSTFYREVSLVYHLDHYKKNIIQKLSASIVSNLPEEIQRVKSGGKVISIQQK
jgi:LysR family hydrogen peroxide-inducible transcriptional activator